MSKVRWVRLGHGDRHRARLAARADIVNTRAELADTLDRLAAKLDVKSRGINCTM